MGREREGEGEGEGKLGVGEYRHSKTKRVVHKLQSIPLPWPLRLLPI